MRRLLSGVLVVALVGAAALLAGAKEEKSGSGQTVKIVFDNAFGLTEGGDFRVGGVKAGKTTKFTATKDSPPKAEVTAEISETGFGDFREDATCTIKPQSLIGEYYVDCQPGKSDQKLPGGRIELERTTSTIPPDLVNNVMRRPYRERLRLIITELGTGLAGRPEDLQEVLKRAHPGLRETSKTLQILGDQNRIIENFIKDSDTVVAQLEARKREVTRFIEEAGDTAAISATRRAELRETFKKLPGFLAELRPTMASLEGLADEQIPLLADAQAAAPDLNTFLTRLGPFAEASRPAVRSLGKTSVVGRRAFERGSNEVAELRQLAGQAPATARPLRQFLESLDDRRRAVDEANGGKDPRGKVDGPPASDPSQNNGGRGGFTGFESLWNYFFWQTLSVNGFDDLGHVLRLGLTVSQCSGYENRSPMRASGAEKAEIEAQLEQCNGWLGPNQPGINAPDPSAGGAAAAVAAQAGKPASRVGERRGTGEPEAGALPGQRDISKPQITLPPGLTDLLDRVPKLPGAGEPPAEDVPQPRAEPGSEQLLDYLLAP